MKTRSGTASPFDVDFMYASHYTYLYIVSFRPALLFNAFYPLLQHLFGWGQQAHFKARSKTPPPIVMKDIVVHPMQMAQALEMGASATVLIACVVRLASGSLSSGVSIPHPTVFID